MPQGLFPSSGATQGAAAGAWLPGILGASPQAHTAFAPVQVSPAAPTWDQAGLVAALNQMALQNQTSWVMDSGASSHMSTTDGILLSHLPSSHSFITVGNGHTIPITCRGESILPTATSNFVLSNVLVVPSLVRNLLSIRQFTRDNNCSIDLTLWVFL